MAEFGSGKYQIVAFLITCATWYEARLVPAMVFFSTAAIRAMARPNAPKRIKMVRLVINQDLMAPGINIFANLLKGPRPHKWSKVLCFFSHVACVASVSVGFGSKERPRNGVFGILPARKMGREPKKERKVFLGFLMEIHLLFTMFKTWTDY